MKSIIKLFFSLTKFNLKIIFAGKFLWFFLASLSYYLLFMVLKVYEGKEINASLIYDLMMIPALLLIFYPASYGIQNDHDSKILEILFGIPNYRYKVWLIRLAMTYIVTFFILFLFALIAYYLLLPINIFAMVLSIITPVFFIGNMMFCLSTLMRSGSGTAIVSVLLIVVFFILGKFDGIQYSQWNVFLDPFNIRDNINPLIWQNVIFKSRLVLISAAVITMLGGILNLQKREKFV